MNEWMYMNVLNTLIISYCLLSSFRINNKWTCFLKVSFDMRIWYFSLFHSSKQECWYNSFSILYLFLFLIGTSMSLKSSTLAKSLLTFLILARWWSRGFRYLIKHNLKHSLSLKFGLSIKYLFLDGSFLWYFHITATT